MSDTDRGAWTKGAYGMEQPLITLPFKSLSYSYQANCWPKNATKIRSRLGS